MTKCRKGFTNIELTIVIAIILVLMSMVVIGLKVVGDSGKKNATKVALETARAMLNEVQAAGVMSRVKDLYAAPFPLYDQPSDLLPVLAGTGNTIVTVDMDADPRWDARRKVVWGPRDKDRWDAAKNRDSTARIMQLLASMPMNQQTMQKMPAEKLEKVFSPDNKDSVVVLRDGWGNPIIFVPAGGLGGVKMKDKTRKIVSGTVTSVGQFLPGETITPGGTGFFASPGPDGDFSTGDDNVYSFGN